MTLRSTPTAWGAIAKTFHWVVAALVIFSTGYGWWMNHVAAALRHHFIKKNDVLQRMGWACLIQLLTTATHSVCLGGACFASSAVAPVRY